MPCTRLENIVERETRAYIGDHIAFVVLLAVIATVLAFVGH